MRERGTLAIPTHYVQLHTHNQNRYLSVTSVSTPLLTVAPKALILAQRMTCPTHNKQLPRLQSLLVAFGLKFLQDKVIATSLHGQQAVKGTFITWPYGVVLPIPFMGSALYPVLCQLKIIFKLRKCNQSCGMPLMIMYYDIMTQNVPVWVA